MRAESQELPAARKAELRSAAVKVLASAGVAVALYFAYSRVVQTDAQVQDLLYGPHQAGGTRSGGARAELNRDTPRGWLAAEDLLRNALAKQSSNTYAVAALADVEVMLANSGFAGHQESAQAAVDRAEGKDAQMPERFEARALQMISQGKAADAVTYLTALLEKYGAVPRIIDALGRAQRASGKLADARASFKRAQDADWRSPRAVADYAQSLLEDGAPLEAAQAFDRALQDNSDHSRSQLGKARALIALSRQGRGGADLKSAKALCAAVLAKPAAEVPSGLKAEALATRAEAKLAEGDAISGAQDASDAIAADPKSRFALRARAMAAAAAKTQDALALFKSAAAADPYDASLYFDGAAALLAAGDSSGSEKLLGSYAGALPQSARFHLALAQSLERRQAYKDAEAELVRAQQLEPTNALVYFEEGRLAQAQKNPKGAQQAYERAAQLRDDFPEVYRQMGALYLENKDVDDALKAFNEALARYKSARTPPPQMESFYTEVVSGVTRAGQKKAAEQWAREARALH
jgi:tetratricopeptide (TPR) repeat protein